VELGRGGAVLLILAIAFIAFEAIHIQVTDLCCLQRHCFFALSKCGNDFD
jgi:hypothetical protein